MDRRSAIIQLGFGVAGSRVAMAQAADNIKGRYEGGPEADLQRNTLGGARMTVAMVAFQDMTQLDFTAPFEVFSHLKDIELKVVAQTMDPIISDSGLRILPTHVFSEVPAADVLFVPGGRGHPAQLTNPVMIDYLSRVGAQARFVTSVCTGALMLAAAGLLEGYRATTHWLAIDYLALFGVHAENKRVVVDRNRITGGGVTAGLDLAFMVVAEMRGELQAKTLELMLEYDPHPPFKTGTPELAGPTLVQVVRDMTAESRVYRFSQAKAAAANLKRRQSRS